MVVFVGGVPVDDLVEVGEVPVQVHAIRIVPSDQVVVVALRDIDTKYKYRYGRDKGSGIQTVICHFDPKHRFSPGISRQHKLNVMDSIEFVLYRRY